jgi:hypothetical protein
VAETYRHRPPYPAEIKLAGWLPTRTRRPWRMPPAGPRGPGWQDQPVPPPPAGQSRAGTWPPVKVGRPVGRSTLTGGQNPAPLTCVRRRRDGELALCCSGECQGWLDDRLPRTARPYSNKVQHRPTSERFTRRRVPHSTSATRRKRPDRRQFGTKRRGSRQRATGCSESPRSRCPGPFQDAHGARDRRRRADDACLTSAPRSQVSGSPPNKQAADASSSAPPPTRPPEAGAQGGQRAIGLSVCLPIDLR